jgi:Omp85 superfamily domain
MKRFITLALLSLLLPSLLYCVEPLPTSVTQEGELDEATPKEKITKPLSQKEMPVEKEGLVNKLAKHLVFHLDQGPLFVLPIIDSSKDLGPNYGVMPILAVRNKKKDTIGAVIAPSINYNKFLRTTYTYRHYIFPDDKKLMVIRGMYSTVVQREIFLHYFDPEVSGTDFRINAEFRHWVYGKASYYGIGPSTRKADESTYALNLTGEEFSITVPTLPNLYFDFTHAFYAHKISEGPIASIEQLENKYPTVFSQASNLEDFLTHKFSIFYDSTDHPTIPKTGIYAGVSATVSDSDFVSDYSYTIYNAQVKTYLHYHDDDRYITAINAQYQHLTGDDVPFYIKPTLGESTGLRAVGDGRFVDRGKLVFNVEQRLTLSRMPILKFLSEVELTPFMDVGTVFGQPSGIQMEKMQWGWGFALRLVLRPQVVAAADFAFGKEGPNVIIHVGYPF